MTSLGMKHFICGLSWVTTLTTLYGSSEAGTSSLKRQRGSHDAGARPMKISRKTSLAPARDELSEIEDSDKHDRHTTKLMAVGGNERVVVLVC